MPRSRSKAARTPPKSNKRGPAPLPGPLPTLQDFIDHGGHIDIGRVYPLECVAITNDDHNMYVALQRHPDETLMDLLTRLDTSLKHCLENDEFIDEINAP